MTTLGLAGLAAFVTSMLSGVLGMAGGVTLVGIFSLFLAPAAVIPVHGVVQLVANATRTVAFLKDVRWSIFAWFSPPLIFGAVAGGWVRGEVGHDWFRPAIGAFVLAFLLWRRLMPRFAQPPLWIYAPVGFAVGFLGLFVGATGPLIAPFFLRDDLAPKEVVATQAVCQAWGHLLKVPAFLALGFDYGAHLDLLVACCLAAVVGTYAGRAVVGRISKRAFTLLFEGVLLILGAHLLGSSFLGN